MTRENRMVAGRFNNTQGSYGKGYLTNLCDSKMWAVMRGLVRFEAGAGDRHSCG